MCMLHLRATTSEGCGDGLAGSLLSQVNQKGVRQSPLPWASRSRFKFPTAENHCVQVLRKGLSELEQLPCCPPVSCETQVISSRCCFSTFPSAESVQKSLLLVSQDSPEIENTTKSHCGFVMPPSTSGRKSCP